MNVILFLSLRLYIRPIASLGIKKEDLSKSLAKVLDYIEHLGSSIVTAAVCHCKVTTVYVYVSLSRLTFVLSSNDSTISDNCSCLKERRDNTRSNVMSMTAHAVASNKMRVTLSSNTSILYQTTLAKQGHK